jgi:hypothetical protein
VDAALVTVDNRLAARDTAVRDAVKADIGRLEAEVATRVRTELDRELPPRLTALDTRTAELAGRAESAHARLDAAETRIAGAEATMLANSRAEANARGDLARNLTVEMDRRDAAQGESFTRELATARGELNRKLDAAIFDARRTILDEARATATQVAVTETKLSATQLRSEFRTFAREEIENAGREGIRIARPIAGGPGFGGLAGGGVAGGGFTPGGGGG